MGYFFWKRPGHDIVLRCRLPGIRNISGQVLYYILHNDAHETTLMSKMGKCLAATHNIMYCPSISHELSRFLKRTFYVNLKEDGGYSDKKIPKRARKVGIIIFLYKSGSAFFKCMYLFLLYVTYPFCENGRALSIISEILFTMLLALS